MFIPVKGPQVAALTVGWLAVALSMAAIGSASVAHVGVGTAESQPRVTVARTVSLGTSATTPVAAPDIVAALSAPTQPAVVTVAVAQDAKPVTHVRTTSAPTAAQTSSALPQVAPTTSPVTVSVGTVPTVGVTTPSGTTTLTPSTPASTKPGKGSTVKHSSGGKATTTSASATVQAASFSAWRQTAGAIWAGCQGPTLTYVDPKPSDGYGATQRASWIHTSITFEGPTRVSVRVGCSDGKPSFSVLD